MRYAAGDRDRVPRERLQRAVGYNLLFRLENSILKNRAQQARLISSEYFSVDGMLIDVWASLCSSESLHT
jgi:hypothetical protein